MADPRKDYYQVLGVSETATADEVKRAYRRLAKKYHPDATGGDKAKETKFKELSEAYEVLGDAGKRAEYDRARKNPFGQGFPGGGFPGGGFPGGGFSGRSSIDIEELLNRRTTGGGRSRSTKAPPPQDSFGDIFGDLLSGFGLGGREAASGRDLTMKAEIDLPVAALGGEQVIVTPTSQRLTVRIPAGLEDGQTIRVAGKGEPARGRTPAGDLLIEVKVKPHPRFRRHGADLEVDVPVTVDEAVLGGQVDVETLEGTVRMRLPAGSSSGLKLRLRGKGAARRADGTCGDLYAVVQIVLPRDIPPQARDLIVEFGRLTRK